MKFKELLTSLATCSCIGGGVGDTEAEAAATAAGGEGNGGDLFAMLSEFNEKNSSVFDITSLGSASEKLALVAHLFTTYKSLLSTGSTPSLHTAEEEEEEDFGGNNDKVDIDNNNSLEDIAVIMTNNCSSASCKVNNGIVCHI